MSDIDTSAEAVKLLAAELCARWDDVFEFLKMREQAAATLRALAAERDVWRAENAKKQVSCEQMGHRIAALDADNERLRMALQEFREMLKWFVDNDETNEGDTPLPEYGGKTWNEINAYWIDGLKRARALLERNVK